MPLVTIPFVGELAAKVKLPHTLHSEHHVSSMNYWLHCQFFWKLSLLGKVKRTRFLEHTKSISRETSWARFRMTSTTWSSRFHTNLTTLNFELFFEHLAIPLHCKPFGPQNITFSCPIGEGTVPSAFQSWSIFPLKDLFPWAPLEGNPRSLILKTLFFC